MVHHHIHSNDPLKLAGEKSLMEKTAAIRATQDINSEDKLLEVLQLLKKAHRIVMVGTGASGLVAKDFSWKLMRIGISAVAERDMHALLSIVKALTQGDVLLLISYSGERQEINLAALEAKRCGATVLAFTGFIPNSLQHSAHHCLYTVAKEQTTQSAAISSTAAQQALTDLHFLALIQRDPEQAGHHIRHSEAVGKKTAVNEQYRKRYLILLILCTPSEARRCVK